MHMQLADLSDPMQLGKPGPRTAEAGSPPVPLDAAQPELSEGPAAAASPPEQVGTAVAGAFQLKPNTLYALRQLQHYSSGVDGCAVQIVPGADARLSRQPPPPQRDGRTAGRQHSPGAAGVFGQQLRTMPTPHTSRACALSMHLTVTARSGRRMTWCPALWCRRRSRAPIGCRPAQSHRPS
jgi:hypothetical protein